MAQLFEEACLGKLSLKNRFVRSATWEGLAAEDGSVTPRLTDMMVELASNDIGLIITGYAFVTKGGQSTPWQMAAWDDRFLPGLASMTEAVHAAGARIALQLVHAGRFSSQELTGERPRVPSADGPLNQALTTGEIEGLIAAFADAAARGKAAGFDAVQLHAAHGFLLSEFLSPAFNRREDSYGGSLQNRARLLLDVVHAVRRKVGEAYPILVKMNSDDFLEDGMTAEEALQVAQLLEKASVDAIEFSGGTPLSEELIPPRPGELTSREHEVYYRAAAQDYQKQVGIPLILVGGIRSFEVAEELVQREEAQFIALSRPLIGEPDLVRRWREGDRAKSVCLSCNGCFGPALEGLGVRCVVLEPEQDRA
ncbi:NADH:flavin oxidoreductase [Geomonas sp. Red69]|uniref:NADH:flavin oxidoreductase n=1 Tax=Geomonas diazotrophica TaxID=2843197 RepID=A0ABX8JNM6_9BACT|nr:MULTISPECIES: NADH:flavin oxidoreductase [Geomonas]MBU5637270.1 NADH:flavin oxidoreductase [Geomonas diazotrophica]QWV99561.1 NADH:flavin oxidoreductase [Geomonas nitrogeniifigens]QXE88736.1 NADH:flavin oxidoreductase [Geomonas nitrogeniifigens]